MACDNNRQVVVCRELTKKFEDVKRGTLKEVSEYFSAIGKIKGEIVLLLSPWEFQDFDDDHIDKFLKDALDFMSIKDAVSFAAKHLKISKKRVYEKALGRKFNSK